MELNFMVVSILSNFNFKMWKSVLSLWHPYSWSCPSLVLPERNVLSASVCLNFRLLTERELLLYWLPHLYLNIFACYIFFSRHWVCSLLGSTKAHHVYNVRHCRTQTGITHASTTTALLIWQPWNVPQKAVWGFSLLARHHQNLPILCSCGQRAGRDPYIALNRRRGKCFRLRDTDWTEACSLSFSTTALGESVRIEPNFTVHREKTHHLGLPSESICWRSYIFIR